MARICYLGDEVTAAGFRLAGAATVVVSGGADDAAQALHGALASSELVLLAADVAQALPRALLEGALLALAPPLLVVPDLAGRAAVPDLAARLREELGLAA